MKTRKEFKVYLPVLAECTCSIGEDGSLASFCHNLTLPPVVEPNSKTTQDISIAAFANITIPPEDRDEIENQISRFKAIHEKLIIRKADTLFFEHLKNELDSKIILGESIDSAFHAFCKKIYLDGEFRNKKTTIIPDKEEDNG